MIPLVPSCCTRIDPPVQIVTSDIPRFWSVFDTASPTELGPRLKADYLAPGSPGLAFFSLAKCGGPNGLAIAIQLHRQEYRKVRAQTLEVAKAEPEIRRVFARYLRLMPEAKIPIVTFVVGRFTSGGTSFPGGIVLGAEMEVNARRHIPAIVAHEATHFNQAMDGNGLLTKTIVEGMADYVGERVAGAHINAKAHAYGRRHEAALWREWRAETLGRNRVLDWIGTYSQTKPRPGDLGYFLGYRICAVYVRRTHCSLTDLLKETDPEKIVRESGYDPK